MLHAQHLQRTVHANPVPVPQFHAGVAVLQHQQFLHLTPVDGAGLLEDQQQGVGLAQAGEVVERGVLVVLEVHVVAAVPLGVGEEHGHTPVRQQLAQRFAAAPVELR